MSIVYNSPDHIKERASVEPLTLAECEELVKYINIHDHYTTNQFKNCMQRLIWEFENLKHAALTQPKWISVDEALPEINTDGYSSEVIVSNGKALGVDHINKETLNGIKIYGITHWMPLPKSPKTK